MWCALDHLGLMEAPVILGDVFIVPGVSTLLILFGIEIFIRFHRLRGHERRTCTRTPILELLERQLLIHAVHQGRVSLATPYFEPGLQCDVVCGRTQALQLEVACSWS